MKRTLVHCNLLWCAGRKSGDTRVDFPYAGLDFVVNLSADVQGEVAHD